MTMNFDTLVLGGGIIGVSVALHLQQRGLVVALVDRSYPGSETSFGNAGLIQRERIYPHAFPRSLGELLRNARNRSPEVRYHVSAMLKLAPFLARYWWHSEPSRHTTIARANAVLIENSVSEHRVLAEAVGATHFFRRDGWIKMFRTSRRYEQDLRLLDKWRDEFDVSYDPLDATEFYTLEPDLKPGVAGAIRYNTSESVSDPQALIHAC